MPERPPPHARAAATASKRSAASRRRRLAPTLGVLALAALVAGVGLAVGRPHREARAGGTERAAVHFTVGVVSCTFTDESRSAENFATGVTSHGRVIPTEIRYPTISGRPGLVETTGAHPAIRHGPFPVIVFAEGYALTPDTYARLLDSWVRAGFVVAAPRFPDTDAAAVVAQHNVDTEADLVNEPRDVGFVTRSLEAAAAGSPCPVLHRLIAPGKVALAGQSDGAEAVAALAYDAKDLEPGLRFRAVAALSGGAFGSDSAAGPEPYDPGPPLLVTQSATDSCNPPQLSTQLYAIIHQRAKWFLELRSAYHLPPYSGSDVAAFAAVAAVTTRFFLLEFSGGAPGAGFVSFGDRAPGVAVLTTGPSPPALAALGEVPASCYAHE